MDDLDQWFAEQILPYEGALTAYLRRVWPDPSEIADLRQEVYVRVYQGAGKQRPPVARFFLFTVARNLLIDRLRKSRVVPIDLMRSEERRVGKECVRKCRFRWSPYHKKKKQ